MAVTARDIARLAGVSISTVSRSLNDNPRISAETRERIKRIAAELDFEFDASARSLSTRRSGTVAIVCPAFLDRFENGLYLNLLIHDLRQGLAARGLDCIVTEAVAPSGASTLRRLVLQRKVDGILLLLSATTPEDWTLIRKRGIPVVQVHYAPSYFDASRLDYFFTDNVLGGRLAAEAMLEAGSGRLACLTGTSPNSEALDRERGWREAQEDRGIAPDGRLRFEAEHSYEAAYTCVRRNIAILREADGLFAFTDIMALGVLGALADEGIAVPRDFRVVGYDDLEIATWVRPRLTTIRQPREEIARLATDRLFSLLEGKGGGVEQRMIAPSLARRESC
ncbi:MAG: LacI family DNA-binding transcriptional regulator [Spirochaetaceae bacterium]|nr:LacI family DNA-binding transcriptional regulator [Spirochaetaceae bacterium]